MRYLIPILLLIQLISFPATRSGSLEAAEKKQRPNILFIYTDDHSHRTVSCYPEAWDWVNTPNIDRLAETGIRFEHAFIGTWCMPSRATLLTGHLPYGVESMRMVGQYPGSTYDPEKCRFWPAVFRENGYTTAHIGKWHTGTDTGTNRDWDHQIVWNRPRFQANSQHYYRDQLIETNGSEAKLVKGYSTDNYTRWANEFIRGDHRDADKPWYLWLCYGAVHSPFTPADRHLNSYPDAKIPIPADIYPPRPGKPAYMQEIAYWEKGPTGEPVLKGPNGPRSGVHGPTLNNWVRQYQQGVLAIDEGIAELIATLKKTGQYDNTLIVFTSDQGFGWGQHGFRHKIAPYDGTIRSPMIVSMPSRLPQGEVCRHAVGGPDIIPTIFSFAGIDLPWKMHGRDLTPILTQPQRDWSHPVLTAFTSASYGSDADKVPRGPELYRHKIPWWLSLRYGRYKYIRTLVEGEIEELYDIEADPEELTNLALNVKHRETLVKYREWLVAELRRTDAKMVDDLPKVNDTTAGK